MTLKMTKSQLKRLERNLTEPKPSTHLRVREDHIVGGTMYHGRCGASGITSRDFAKELSKVGCLNCRKGLEK